MAAAAVYAADRLEGGWRFIQANVAEAASRIIETSSCKVGTYSRELMVAHTGRALGGSIENRGTVLGGALAD